MSGITGSITGSFMGSGGTGTPAGPADKNTASDGAEHRIKVWAHRGASGYAPENTMEAYILAHQYGADGIELDVQLSKDGEIVVIHDEKIDRTSNGRGLVRSFTVKQLRGYNYNRTNPTHFHAQIPTLREVLEYVHDQTRMTINIELKTGVYFYPGIEERTVALVHELDMHNRVIYSSFNHYSIRKIRQIEPKARCGLLYSGGFIGVPKYAANLGVNALHPAWYCLQYPDYLEDCRKYHLDLNVWTVNEEDMMLQLCKAGVNALITNYPDKAVRIRDEYERNNGMNRT